MPNFTPLGEHEKPGRTVTIYFIVIGQKRFPNSTPLGEHEERGPEASDFFERRRLCVPVGDISSWVATYRCRAEQ